VKLRCYLLSFLRIHRPDCEHCNARGTCGDEMRKRLEELSVGMQPHPLNNGVFDSKPGEVVAGAPISEKAQQKKLA
jgi:hypothetical protein